MNPNRLLVTVEIARPHNMLAAAVGLLAGYVLSGGRSWVVVAAPVVLTAVVTGLGNLINDYYDAEADRINKPYRPLPSSRLTPTYVWRTYWVGTLVATVLCVLLVPVPLRFVLLAWQCLLYLYARKAKRVMLLGNLVVAGVASSAFLGGAALTGRYPVVMFAFAFAFVYVMGRELVKGAEDIDGDRQTGAKTVAVAFGVLPTLRVAVACLVACCVIAPVPVLVSYYGRAYGLTIELAVAPIILVAAHMALRSPERSTLHRASRWLKIGMFFGIVAMGLGRI